MFLELRDALGILTYYVRTTDIEFVIVEFEKISVNGTLIKLNEESFKKVIDYINHTNKMYYNAYN